MTTTPTDSPTQGTPGVVIAGWIFVALLPFIGLCIGVDAYTKGHKIEGRQIMVAGAMLSLFWVVIGLVLTS